MNARSVDFRTIKERARFETILAHYGVALMGSGTERSALCPFHSETRPSFRVNVTRKVFCCFGCEAKGDILDFVAAMEAVPIVEAAELIASVCGIDAIEVPIRSIQTQNAKPKATSGNKPLTFTLTLDPDHPYLVERGIPRDMIDVFGLGYCHQGVMRGRVCIPIHDEKGRLVAYAGRWPGDDLPEGTSKYRLPRGFRKNEVLFNLRRAAAREHLVLVEGYWSVIRLHRLSVPAVALMGRTLSLTQEALLKNSGARLITLLLDGDEPGRTATAGLLPRLSDHFFVRTVTLRDGEAPDTIPEETLRNLVRTP